MIARTTRLWSNLTLLGLTLLSALAILLSSSPVSALPLAQTAPAAPAVGPTAPPAPTPSVQVARDELDYRFAESMRFELDAASEQPIEDVVLRYTVGTDDDLPRNRRIPEFTPGREIRAVHAEDLVRGQIPPASPITWWWALTTAEGATFETEPQSLRYFDERFDWQSTEGEDLRVWWYDAEPDFAAEIETRAREALGELGALVGSTPDRRIEIVAYQSQEDLRPALIDRGGIYESRLATLGARVGPDILLLDAGTRSEDLFEVLKHELSHIVLHLHLDKDYISAPLWLDEGLAMYAEGELAGDEQALLDQAIASDSLMSFRSLTSFPGDAELVSLAYAESRDMVAFLLETYGEEKFRDLIDAIGSAQLTLDQALVEVYGMDQLDLYEAYRAARDLAPAATPEPGAAAPSRRVRQAGGSSADAAGGPCGSAALAPLGLAVLWWGRRRRSGMV